MKAEADELIPAAGLRPGSPARVRGVGVVVRRLAMLIAAACALVVSNNWCFVLFPAAFAAWCIDHVVGAIRPWFILRAPVAAAVGVAAGTLLSVGPDWAFREAFEMAPPAGVHNVRIWRHYVGGPGEHVLIIEFTADTAAIQSLVRAHPPSADSDNVQRWQVAGGGWAQAFDVFAGPGLRSFANSSWRRIQPLDHPVALDLGESNGGRLVLLHDPNTGRCVALHVRS